MAHFAYRSGNGNEIITPKAAGGGREDEAPRRAWRARREWVKEPSSGWRVLARLPGGGGSGEVLLCLGATRAEAAALARERLAAGSSPPDARLLLQRWRGDRLAGEWVTVPADETELPGPRPRPRRSRLVGGE